MLTKIEPNASQHKTFTSLGGIHLRVILLIEVTLDSRELAIKIQTGYSERKDLDKI